MAQHKSAERQMRRSLRRKAINKSSRSAYRTKIKNLRSAVDSQNAEEAQNLLPGVFRAIDRAVKKGSIHKNTGSRYKSRLSRQVAAIIPESSK